MQRFASGPGPFAFFDAPWTPVFLFVLFVFHWLLGVLAVVSGVLLVALALLNSVAHRPAPGRGRRGLGEVPGISWSSCACRRPRRCAGSACAAHALARSGALRTAALAGTMAASDRGGAFAVTSRTLRLFLQSMMLGLGAWLAIRGEVTPGIMIAASILLGRALAPIDQAVGQWPVLQAALRGRRSLATLLRETPEEPARTPLPDPKAVLEAMNLVVAAPGAKVPAVKRRVVPPGARPRGRNRRPVGLGQVDAGKRALAGVWPPLAGKAALGRRGAGPVRGRGAGAPCRVAAAGGGAVRGHGGGEHRAVWRPSAGSVRPWSRRRNAFGGARDDPGSCRAATTSRWRPGGAALSGGQRQRIALARVFHGDPAGGRPRRAGRASRCGRRVRRSTGRWRISRARGGAAVIVAHHPAVFAECDQVLLMEDGRLRPAVTGGRDGPGRARGAGRSGAGAPGQGSAAREAGH